VNVRPGSVIFVPSGEPHQFHDIATDLAALVFFAPAYGSRGLTSDEDPSASHEINELG
jgi:mannose-6-phosphate isomerase-like protein (cupin superfamily)